ncbi:MAG: hypothetical protein DSZ29_05435 [Aquificaceae bacterium]|nr:MAG: hypothetical protein DSZ29_05435 [Aquificaceae bacterium]
MKRKVRKKYRLFAFLVLSIFPNLVVLAAGNELGKTILARGTVTADRNNARAPLKRRSLVFRQDILRSGANARAQFRMIDNALINLQENSVLRLREYKLKTAQGNGSVVMELITGGLRTITGTIGKQNKKDYQLRTPAATIGIRGTMYEVEITAEGMYVGTWKGDIDIHSYSGKCHLSLGDKAKNRFALVDNQGVCKVLANAPKVFRDGHSSKAGATTSLVGINIDPLLENPQKKSPYRSFTVGQGSRALLKGRADRLSSNPVITTDANGVVSSTTNATDFSQNIGGYPVGWGRWNKYNVSTELGGIPNPQNDKNGLLWSSYKPSATHVVASRVGVASYTHTIDSLAQSSMGKVSNVAVQMDVDFANGQVSNGAISARVPNYTWVGVFDGKVAGGKLSLDFNGGALVNAQTGVSSDATGSIAGDFVGDNAEAITGGFNMVDSKNSDNQIEGLFLVGEK